MSVVVVLVVVVPFVFPCFFLDLLAVWVVVVVVSPSPFVALDVVVVSDFCTLPWSFDSVFVV